MDTSDREYLKEQGDKGYRNNKQIVFKDSTGLFASPVEFI